VNSPFVFGKGFARGSRAQVRFRSATAAALDKNKRRPRNMWLLAVAR
jgi:hypothetical protein